MKSVITIIACIFLLFLGLDGFVIYRAVTTTTLGLIAFGGAVSSNTLVQNLSSNDPDLVMSSLDMLKDRKDPAGQTQAHQLLSSSNDYLWFNSALYLGAIKDPKAIPFLIKGLKHPASRAYPEIVAELQALTPNTFGEDQARWIAWWKQQNPNSAFSFDYASLRHQAALISTGADILINGVIDPLHVGFLGSPIRLIGIRLKPGANPAQAKRLVETAVLGQCVHVTRDGVQPDADGAVPALIDWVPVPINGPALADLLRRGLPPVPFTQQSSVQLYLLRSGLYEPDPSAIQDTTLRAAFEKSATPTTPAT